MSPTPPAAATPRAVAPAPGRRAARSRRAAAAVALVLLAGGLGGCGGGSGQPGRSGAPATTTTTAPPTTLTVPPVQLAVTATELLATDGVVPLPDAVATATAGVADRWVRATTLAPLASGSVGDDLDALVTDAVRARLQGPDRAVLVDDGLGAGGPVHATRAEVALTGLAGGADRSVAVVVARVALDVSADDGAHVVRDGQLVLVPAGEGWLVDGYSMSVTRSDGAAVTHSTAEAPATTVASP